MRRIVHYILISLCLAACKGAVNTPVSTAIETRAEACPTFSADSAYAHIVTQCGFGPRVMNSAAHDACEEWIVAKFESYGLAVQRQKATLCGYDGTALKATNIIASYHPERKERVLLCAHWDSRPWADNDPNEANHHTPLDAANDGASGVAVMMEIARVVTADSLSLGLDFICFDAEDWGLPRWAERVDDSNTWALGSTYWAEHPHVEGYSATYGVLFDMVGGQGARFYREAFSDEYAPEIVQMVWTAASTLGYSTFFPHADGGAVMDDHVPVNEVAGIPTIDIIPHYPDCSASSFGPTWHTLSDDVAHIDKSTLRAVGQTITYVLFR